MKARVLTPICGSAKGAWRAREREMTEANANSITVTDQLRQELETYMETEIAFWQKRYESMH